MATCGCLVIFLPCRVHLGPPCCCAHSVVLPAPAAPLRIGLEPHSRAFPWPCPHPLIGYPDRVPCVMWFPGGILVIMPSEAAHILRAVCLGLPRRGLESLVLCLSPEGSKSMGEQFCSSQGHRSSWFIMRNQGLFHHLLDVPRCLSCGVQFRPAGHTPPSGSEGD